MRVKVRAERQDLLSGEREELYAGSALASTRELRYREKDGARTYIGFFTDQVVLERNGEVNSRIELPKEKTGKTVIQSDLGDMVLTAELIDQRFAEDCWEVEYRILEEDHVVAHQRLVWWIEH